LWRWDVKFFATRVESVFPIKELGPLIQEGGTIVRPALFPNETFKILGVTNDSGVIDAYDAEGKEINQPYQRVQAGDFVYNPYRVNVGSVGIVPQELGGHLISPAYVVFSVCEPELIPEFLLFVLQAQRFNGVLRAATAGSVRQSLTYDLLRTLKIPVPPPSEQEKLLGLIRNAQGSVSSSFEELDSVAAELDAWLTAQTNSEVFDRPWLALDWRNLKRWDVKSARAAAFRLAHPEFVPFGTYAEEATESVKPWQEPEKEWPVYGVNNKDGVFFSHHQRGAEFNATYKHIQRDWFFHNPTRSAVGSLGIVPEVPADALTSSEYQVWRLRDIEKNSLVPQFVASLIRTPWFVKLIQFHRVGAVKQRLYVENLLEIPVPRFPRQLQNRIASERQAALERLAKAKERAAIVKQEVEEMILGTRPVPSAHKKGN
jgi:hypothetical protein